MKSYPLVHVLTLNWNGKEVTIECVESLLKSDYPNFKVVVIDNGSTDDSVLALKKSFGNRIIILRNKSNLGYARGFNAGLKYGFREGFADYCLVMNNDTVIDAKAIAELVKVAETDQKIGFVTGKVYYYDKPNILQTVGKKEDPIKWNGGHMGRGEEDKGQYDEICERFFADDIYTLVSKELYMNIGGYNPMFFLQGEEYDWQARAKKSEYKIIYTPYAKLWHRESWTFGQKSAKKAYYDARNPMLVVLLHKPPQFFKRYFWNHIKNTILESLIFLKSMRFYSSFRNFQGLLSGLWWGIRNKKLSLQHFI